MVLTVSSVLSPVTGLVCHRRLRGKTFRENLTPASGRQDHTTSPSASVSLVWRHHRVHRILCPTFVTIAKRPSGGHGTRRTERLICGKAQARHLRHIGTTGKSVHSG